MKKDVNIDLDMNRLRLNRTLHKKLEKIAQNCLNIETLETRRWDELDFHDCSVWCLKDALIMAYKLGVETERKKWIK